MLLFDFDTILTLMIRESSYFHEHGITHAIVVLNAVNSVNDLIECPGQRTHLGKLLTLRLLQYTPIGNF